MTLRPDINKDGPAALRLKELLRRGELPHTVLFEYDRPEDCPYIDICVSAIICGVDGYAEENGRGCGDCSSCLKFKDGQHPDVISLHGEGARNNVPVAKIREMLAELSVFPNDASKKVIIIHSAGDLGIESQNVLLKALEEPPSFVHFILVTTDRRLLLETILSRCMIFSFTADAKSADKKYEHLTVLFIKAAKTGSAFEFYNALCKVIPTKREEAAEAYGEFREALRDTLVSNAAGGNMPEDERTRLFEIYSGMESICENLRYNANVRLSHAGVAAMLC